MDLVDRCGLRVEKACPGTLFARASLRDTVVGGALGWIDGELTVRLDAVLRAVGLPAGVARNLVSIGGREKVCQELWLLLQGSRWCNPEYGDSRKPWKADRQ